eukprot:TRINITY_DN21640_c0_g1_i1.p2 TRINITY_DN21640_c0_g1~~TRINITY_DN21640_c0_g1_i1.p2  ORF type:complete len:193 (+),score=18.73 TRINITY_DN21640_c0_g1_i1:1652-2230(+)
MGTARVPAMHLLPLASGVLQDALTAYPVGGRALVQSSVPVAANFHAPEEARVLMGGSEVAFAAALAMKWLGTGPGMFAIFACLVTSVRLVEPRVPAKLECYFATEEVYVVTGSMERDNVYATQVMLVPRALCAAPEQTVNIAIPLVFAVTGGTDLASAPALKMKKVVSGSVPPALTAKLVGTGRSATQPAQD